MEEIVTGYGPIDILWLDAGQVRPPAQDIRMDDLAAMARRHRPDLLIVDRTVGGKYEDYRTPEQEVPAKALVLPWESCITLGTQWSYKPGDRYKPAREVVRLLVDVVAKGGNLLLNVGARPDGTLPPEAVERLAELGSWLRVNGEAIYGTRPAPPWKAGRVALTRKGKALYAIVLLEEGEARLPARVAVPGTARPGARVTLLGAGGRVPAREEGRDLIIDVAGGDGGGAAVAVRGDVPDRGGGVGGGRDHHGPRSQHDSLVVANAAEHPGLAGEDGGSAGWGVGMGTASVAGVPPVMAGGPLVRAVKGSQDPLLGCVKWDEDSEQLNPGQGLRRGFGE